MRQDTEIKDILIGKKEVKSSQFADNMILQIYKTPGNPLQSIRTNQFYFYILVMKNPKMKLSKQFHL